MTPQILIEEYDDLDEQDVVDEELAAQPTEDEDRLEADLNRELTEYPFEEILDQQQENIVKEFQEDLILDQTSNIETTSE